MSEWEGGFDRCLTEPRLVTHPFCTLCVRAPGIFNPYPPHWLSSLLLMVWLSPASVRMHIYGCWWPVKLVEQQLDRVRMVCLKYPHCAQCCHCCCCRCCCWFLQCCFWGHCVAVVVDDLVAVSCHAWCVEAVYFSSSSFFFLRWAVDGSAVVHIIGVVVVVVVKEWNLCSLRGEPQCRLAWLLLLSLVLSLSGCFSFFVFYSSAYWLPVVLFLWPLEFLLLFSFWSLWSVCCIFWSLVVISIWVLCSTLYRNCW